MWIDFDMNWSIHTFSWCPHFSFSWCLAVHHLTEYMIWTHSLCITKAGLLLLIVIHISCNMYTIISYFVTSFLFIQFRIACHYSQPAHPSASFYFYFRWFNVQHLMPIKIASTVNVYTGIPQYLLLYLYNVQFVVTENNLWNLLYRPLFYLHLFWSLTSSNFLFYTPLLVLCVILSIIYPWRLVLI